MCRTVSERQADEIKAPDAGEQNKWGRLCKRGDDQNRVINDNFTVSGREQWSSTHRQECAGDDGGSEGGREDKGGGFLNALIMSARSLRGNA